MLERHLGNFGCFVEYFIPEPELIKFALRVSKKTKISHTQFARTANYIVDIVSNGYLKEDAPYNSDYNRHESEIKWEQYILRLVFDFADVYVALSIAKWIHSRKHFHRTWMKLFPLEVRKHRQVVLAFVSVNHKELKYAGDLAACLRDSEIVRAVASQTGRIVEHMSSSLANDASLFKLVMKTWDAEFCLKFASHTVQRKLYTPPKIDYFCGVRWFRREVIEHVYLVDLPLEYYKDSENFDEPKYEMMRQRASKAKRRRKIEEERFLNEPKEERERKQMHQEEFRQINRIPDRYRIVYTDVSSDFFEEKCGWVHPGMCTIVPAYFRSALGYEGFDGKFISVPYYYLKQPYLSQPWPKEHVILQKRAQCRKQEKEKRLQHEELEKMFCEDMRDWA